MIPLHSYQVHKTLLAALSFLTLPLSAEVDHKAIAGFLGKYCIECHGSEKQKGDRQFDEMILPVHKMDTLIDLKDIMDQINLGDMPPEDSKQPSQPEVKAFLDQMNLALVQGREKLASTGGGTVLRRLNRREYINTIGELFAMNMEGFDPTTKFPRDQSAEHMENLGDVLQTSGYLLDQYLDAADTVVEKVFALKEPPAEQTWIFKYEKPAEAASSKGERKKKDHELVVIECMDVAQHEGGFAYIEEFKQGVPADGFYELKVSAQAMNRINPYDPEIFDMDFREPFRLGIVPGDAKVGPLDLPQIVQPMLAEYPLVSDDPQSNTLKVWLHAGQTLRFVFPNGPKSARKAWGTIAKFHAKKTNKDGRIGIVEARRITMTEGKYPLIRIHEVQIRGPLESPWPPPTLKSILGDSTFTAEKMREVLQFFANRAYRRLATPDEINRLMAVAKKRMSAGQAPLEGLKDALKAALCSPSFLYLSHEVVDVGADQKKRPQLDSFALASRLSYFLWSSMPDAELFRLARSGELLQPEVIVAQTRRMLASPRSDIFVESFLDSWLNLRSLGSQPPDRGDFETYYSKGLQQAFKKETQLFMRDLINRNASIVNFLDADYGFMNQALATHYGLGDLGDPARAHEFRRVPLKDSRRGGLLGMGSVLTVTANGIETSPVTRGVFLLENILGTPPPPPPDDVPQIDPDVRGAQTIREQLSKHRESPNCAGCHQKIDPLGFALENFDPVGSWRTGYNKKPIDTSGELPSGEKFAGVTQLKKILVERQDLFAHMLTDRLLTYACGRRMEVIDDPVIEKIVTQMRQKQYGLRSFIEAVVVTELFRGR